MSKLFGTERGEVTREWRGLYNEEFYDPYCSPYFKSRTTEWMGHIARTRRESIYIHKVLIGKPERKRSLGKARRRWEYNIKTDIQEIG